MYTDDMHTHRNRKKKMWKCMVVCIWKMSISFEWTQSRVCVACNVRISNCEIQKLDAFFFMLLLLSYTNTCSRRRCCFFLIVEKDGWNVALIRIHGSLCFDRCSFLFVNFMIFFSCYFFFSVRHRITHFWSMSVNNVPNFALISSNRIVHWTWIARY